MTGDYVAISVPGDSGTLIMRHPEWVELAEGWQLGGWVDPAEAYEFSALHGTDRLTVTYGTGSPEFVTLRGTVAIGTNRGLKHVYLKIPAAGPPTRPRSADSAPASADFARSPMLHQNGTGTRHLAAFAEAAEADQIRHLNRQHSFSDTDRARQTATDPGKPLASLAEAHEWWHARLSYGGR